MRYDWWLTALIGLAAVWAAARLTRQISVHLVDRLQRFRRLPRLGRYLILLGVLWLGLRLARTGARAFLAYVLIVGGLSLWALCAQQLQNRQRP